MQYHKGKRSFLQHLKDDNKSTNSTIVILRQLNQATNALKDAQADGEYESAHGPRTIKQKVWLGLFRLGRALWRELSYVGIWAHKALLIVLFNAIAIFLFFWLLSLI